MEWVAGFLFTPDRSGVALIEKKKPEWQAGKLNGIGGKIEEGETPEQAMVREFREEAGVEITDWRIFARLHWSGGIVYFFSSIGKPALGTYHGTIRSMTDELVSWYSVHDLLNTDINPEAMVQPVGTRVLPNLRWLVPMALDDHIQIAEIIDNS
jgi:8-oxo-dGTP diphosphatase